MSSFKSKLQDIKIKRPHSKVHYSLCRHQSKSKNDTHVPVYAWIAYVLKQRYLFYNNKLINEDKNVKLKCLKIPSVKVLKLMKNTINDEAKMSNYCLFHERRQEIHRQWKDDGGVFL